MVDAGGGWWMLTADDWRCSCPHDRRHVGSRRRFAGAQRWLQEVKAELDDVVVVLVGSKCDLVAERKVDGAMAARLAEGFSAEHIECSAKDGTTVAAVRPPPPASWAVSCVDACSLFSVRQLG